MRFTHLKRRAPSAFNERRKLRTRQVLTIVVWVAFVGSGAVSPAEAQPDSSPSSRAYVQLDDAPALDVRDPGWNDSSGDEWVWLPEGYIYPTYLGNPHEPRLGTHGISIEGDGVLWDNNLGGRFGLFRFGPRDTPEGVQLDFLGGVKLRIDPERKSEVRSYDFRADIPLTWGAGPHRWKFGYSHTSSHTGDEYLLRMDNPTRLNYIRDSAVLGYSFYPVPELRFYGQAEYALYHAGAEPWLFQFGIDIAPAHPTAFRGAPFLTLAGELHEEFNYGGAFIGQAGWAWRGRENPSGILRLGMFYYNGKSSQFSFLNQFEEQLGGGMWYDF